MKSISEHTVSEITEAIETASNILVTSHRDCDGDSVGSQLAVSAYLTSLKKRHSICHHSSIPEILASMPNVESICDSSGPTFEPLSKQQFDLAIVVDCSDISRVGDVLGLIGSNTRVINIDHHADNSNFGDIQWLEPTASSVCEMIARFFEAVALDYDRDTAECLYIGIMTDTGRFRFNSTSSLTMNTVAEILQRNLDVQEISDRIYFAQKPQALRLVGAALRDVVFSEDERICIVSLSKKDLENAGANQDDTEGIVDYTLAGANSQVGAFVRENGSPDQTEVKVSLRSRGNWDVSAVARQFGGGGHRNAAGCKIEAPLDEAVKKINEKLTQLLSSTGGAQNG